MTIAKRSAVLLVAVLAGCAGEAQAREALTHDGYTDVALTPAGSTVTTADFAFTGRASDDRDCTGTIHVERSSPFSTRWTIDAECQLPSDPTRLAAMCETASHAEACGRASRIFRDGVGVAADADHAFRLAQTGCQAGNAAACFYEGYAHEHGGGTPVDVAEAVRCYRSACAQDDVASCGNLGSMLSNATPPDFAGAIEAYAHSCRLPDHGDDCHQHAALVLLHEEGRSHEELVRAVETEVSECDAGAEDWNLEACHNAGIEYRNGDIVPADLARGRTFHRRACDAHRLTDCTDLGASLLQGDGADPAAALTLFRTACEGGDAMGCRDQGVVLRDGAAGIAPDADASHTAFDRACTLGDAPSCHEIHRQ